MAGHPVPSPAPTSVHTVAPLPGRITHAVGKDGYLESYTLGVTMLALAGAVAVAWIATAALRRRRGRRLLPKLPRWSVVTANALLMFVLTLIGVLVMVNNYVGYVPTLNALFSPPGTTVNAGSLHHVTDAARSRVLRLRIPAPQDGIRGGTTYVYLPPGYDEPAKAGRRYPVIYLFHGYPGRAQDWITAGRVQSTMDLLLREHYVGPMIVVSPSVSTGYLNDDECLDAPGQFNLERYLTVDVVAAIDRSFRTYTDRAHRAIGGMSSGGYCALNLGLHHLHRFSVILASEPYGDPGLHPLHRLLNGDWALWRANSPSFYIPLWHFYLPVASFLDSGGFDRHTTGNALRLARQLAFRGQEAMYRPAPHQHHNWREARAALPYALIFAWQHFGHMVDGGSDAADFAQFVRVLDYARTLPPPRVSIQRTQPPTAQPTSDTAPPSPTPDRSSTAPSSPAPTTPPATSASPTGSFVP